MASLLRIDQDAIVGKLLRVWVWADQNSVGGEQATITAAFIDRLTNRRGFAAAMRTVGWLQGNDGALEFPNFTRHNGITAKMRSETNRRVKNHRERNEDVTQKPLQKPLPEKRREEEEKNKGGEGEPPPPIPAESEDAHIPTAAEVVNFGSSGTAIPPEYCENYHAKTSEKRMWLNAHGKLIDWKRQITRWWAGDKGSWASQKRAETANNGEIPAGQPVAPVMEHIWTIQDMIEEQRAKKAQSLADEQARIAAIRGE